MLRSLIVTFFISTQAFAWGPMGHKIVAQIAETNLSAKAQTEIKNILGTQTMPEVAIWADSIRNQKDWEHTKTWHYVSIPDNESYEVSQKDPEGDVIISINDAIAKLKDQKTSKEDKLNYLKFLIHFVGDIHQPLHVGRAEDRGGNEIQINFQGRACNLHALWDSVMIDAQKISVADYAKKLQTELAPDERADKIDFNYDQIVKENMTLRTKIYDFKNPDLGADYLKKNVSDLNGRLFLGGKRLAAILNSIFN